MPHHHRKQHIKLAAKQPVASANSYTDRHGPRQDPSQFQFRMLNQRNAAHPTRRLTVPTYTLAGWFLPICKNVASSDLLQFCSAQMLLSRSWRSISLENVIAREVIDLLASYLLCCLWCAVNVGLSKREGARLLKTKLVLQFDLQKVNGVPDMLKLQYVCIFNRCVRGRAAIR